ncbi:hypothetical protein LAZ40_02300 [Cereibacter sphaeroides]|uniref:hypothetical protein n=1 Tax=Cereibacter sphaeroides TaxID=1063 RepID=UPI001F351C97|nr:hypothetical protein [Cereibacter sphaeroides]MCE6957889.1 hypothetical protein [Cereibacter sphaeroides]MCE6971763.1 hypothetical protein [Cereibacter sphaeroides]
MAMSEAKRQKVLRNTYRACLGKTFHEKIVHAPEALYREAKGDPDCSQTVRDARLVADFVARTQHRYVLDDEVSGAALAVAEMRGESLQKVLEHIRVPHGRLWIEFNEAGRNRMAEVAGARFRTARAFFPRNTALMIESDPSGRRGMVEFACFDPAGGPFLYPIAFEFDLDNPHLNRSPVLRESLTGLPIHFERQVRNHGDMPTRSWMEHVRLHQGMKVRDIERPADTWRAITGRQTNLVHDVVPEFRFMISVLAMLSLRNGIRPVAEPVAAPARLPGGSLGRRLELQATTCPTMVRVTMALSHDADRDRRQKRGQPAAPGRHWVCGHFKVRATGIFWWSPHKRGDAARDLTTVPREIRVIRPPRGTSPDQPPSPSL